MSVLNFTKANTAQSLQAQLKGLAADLRFSWIASVTQQTADEYVAAKVQAATPGRYGNWMVEANIEEAGRLLNNSLDLRSEIMALEVQGMQAALDIQLAEQAGAVEAEIGAVGLSAAYVQANIAAPVENLNDKRWGLISAARDAQISLHNISGAALNYGQRVDFLRSLYLDNVNQVYDRLTSVWIGLESYFGATLDKPPAWTGAYDSLYTLVHWLRDANVILQQGMNGERRYEVYIGLMQLTKSQLGTGSPFDKLLQNEEIVFELTSDNFPGITESQNIRLLAAGLAVRYNTLPPAVLPFKSSDERAQNSWDVERLLLVRRGLGFNFQVGFPVQESTLAGLKKEERRWQVPPLTLNGYGPWLEGSAQDGVRMTQERQFMNVSPIGSWKLSMRPDFNPLWEGAKSYNPFITQPEDVVLGLRLAVRG